MFAPLRVQAALAIAVPHALVALKAHRSAQNALEVGLAFLESMSAVESHRVSASVEAWRSSRSPCRLQYWSHVAFGGAPILARPRMSWWTACHC